MPGHSLVLRDSTWNIENCPSLPSRYPGSLGAQAPPLSWWCTFRAVWGSGTYKITMALNHWIINNSHTAHEELGAHLGRMFNTECRYKGHGCMSAVHACSLYWDWDVKGSSRDNYTPIFFMSMSVSNIPFCAPLVTDTSVSICYMLAGCNYDWGSIYLLLKLLQMKHTWILNLLSHIQHLQLSHAVFCWFGDLNPSWTALATQCEK